METEYPGSKYWAMLLEARQLPLSMLFYRVRWEAAKRLGVHKKRYLPSKLTNSDVVEMFAVRASTPEGLLQYFRTRNNVRYYFSRDDVPKIRRVWNQRLPSARAKLVAAADRICRGEFSFLGSKPKAFADGINWHDDLSGCGGWPMRHWSKIDVRSGNRVGDVKRTWELNRTQFFVTLARAYALTEEERYVRELCIHMRSWIKQNPPELGVNWYSNLECALRSTSWLFALEMTLHWQGWDAHLFSDIIRCLIIHHHHLYKDISLSEHTMAGNHLLGDAMGIVLLSLYFPELEHAESYKKKGLQILVREGSRQLLEDGVSFENAISYHRFVYYMYVLVGLMLERNGGSLPRELWQRLSAMCDFVVHMRTPPGRICQIGDWDNGRTIVLDDSEVDDFASMLCTGAVLFNRGELKTAAGGFREEALWLCGPGAARTFDKLASVTSKTLDKAHRHSGYFMWRSAWTSDAEYVLFKCAPFRAHTHADNLMVLYSAGGKDWLVDRGTYTYNGPWDWRTYFRSTRSHNTVIVDGMGQSLAHRVFRWLKQPQQVLHTYHANQQFGYASASTTGFRHLRSSVRHARSLLLVRSHYLLILDALYTTSSHDFQLLWHIAPGHEMTLDGGRTARSNDRAGANLIMTATASVPLTGSVVTGETDPIQGWHSRVYGYKEPAPTLVYEVVAREPFVLATVVAITKGSAHAASVLIDLDHAPSAWGDGIRLRVVGRSLTADFNDLLCMPNPDVGSAHERLGRRPWLERHGQRFVIGCSARDGAAPVGG